MDSMSFLNALSADKNVEAEEIFSQLLADRVNNQLQNLHQDVAQNMWKEVTFSQQQQQEVNTEE